MTAGITRGLIAPTPDLRSSRADDQPCHAEGARAALRLIAPALLGLDPTNHASVYDTMDAVLMGHAYAKSSIDLVRDKPRRLGRGRIARTA